MYELALALVLDVGQLQFLTQNLRQLFEADVDLEHVLAFAFTVEFLQAVDVVALLGFEKYAWLSIAIGRTFSWSDLLAYSVGAVVTSFDPWAPKPAQES